MIRLVVVDRFTGTESTSEVANSTMLVTGARLTETPTGLPYLRIEPRVEKGLTLTESQAAGEAYTTSKIGIKLKTVSGATQGLDFEQDTTAGKTHEHFLRIKLGTGLQFNAASGAIEATGTGTGGATPATTTALGTVIVGDGLNVVTAAGPTQGTLSLAVATASQLGGVKQGSGVTIAADGTISASGSLSGTGTGNRVAKWSGASALTNSNINDDGTTVAVTGAVTVSTTLGVTGAATLSSTLGVSGLSTLTRATINAVAAAPQTLLVNAGLNASGDGLTITANTRQLADASNSLLLLISRTNQEALKVSITGQLTLGSGILWGTDATFDIGGSGNNRPKDIYATGKLTLGTNPAPGSGAGSASPLRVAGASNGTTFDAAFFTGAVYATDFILLDGTGSVAAGGPPIVVIDDANGTLTTSGQPLSQMTFTGAGVTATQTATGQVTVNIPGGGGGGVVMQSGSSTANALPKFFNSSTTPTLANSRLSDDGTTITLGGNTSVSGTLTATNSVRSTSGMTAWNTTTPGLGQGNLHIGTTSATTAAGGAITFGARDNGDASGGQAGIYVTSDGTFGTRMYFATTDAYVSGAKTAFWINNDGTATFTRARPTYAGNVILDSANYNTYAPSLQGVGATGTNWGISVTGTATNVTGTVAIANGGTGQTSAAAAINALLPSQASQNNKVLGTNGTNVSWVTMTSAATISDDTTTNATRFVLFDDVTTGNLTAVNTSSTKLTFNPSTGVLTASGGFSGNASTATTLATARNINGTSFNGSANITTASWGTARNITIGGTTRSVDGSTTYSWSLTDIGAVASTSTLTINGTTNQVTVTGGAQDLSANRTWTVGLPNSVAITTALDVGTVTGVTAATLRVGGDVRLTGTIYATDFVLTDGAGGTAPAGPPIVVVDESSPLNTTGTPLSQLTFAGAGVTASQTAVGQITVTIPGGSGGIAMQSGNSTANALPKFFNAAASPTLANSRLSDDGTTIGLGGNTTVTGTLVVGTDPTGTEQVRVGGTIKATTFSGSGASLTGIPISAVTSLQTTLDGKAASTHNHDASAINAGTLSIARGGTGVATAPVALQVLVGQTGGSYAIRTLAGSGGSWADNGTNLTFTVSGGGGVTVSNDTTTNSTFYPLFTSATTGTITAQNVSSSKLSFNPSTGVLTTSGGFAGLTGSQVTGALGFTPYNSTNPSGYITSGFSMFIGTTSVALNRASGALTLAGVSLSTLTISTGLSGTSYNGSGAVTIAIDSSVTTLTGTQTLTNKTLTSPTINTATITAGSLAYKVGGVNYSTSDVSGTAAAGTPDGALWVVYTP